MTNNLLLLQILQNSLIGAAATGKEVLDVGPFQAFINPEMDVFWMNYALPVTEPIEPTDIQNLIGLFQSRERIPRIEMIETLWPSLPALLQAKGFERQMRMPVMVCTRESFVPATKPIEVKLLQAEDDPRSYMAAGGLAFSDDAPITDGRVERWRTMMSTGHFCCAQATVGDVVAGVGCLMPHGGAAELAGIGTVPDFRRRGIASVVSSALMEGLWADNEEAIIWLSAADDRAKSVYEKLGFAEVGIQENWQFPTS